MDLQNILEPVDKELSELSKSLLKAFDSGNIIVEQIIKYVLTSGGKRLRPALVFLFAGMTDTIKSEHHALAAAVELIHNATLIHDDIIDSADKRHNLPSVHAKWDSKSAVLAGDYLLAKALDFLVETKNNDVLRLFTHITKEICQGEIQQFTAKNDFSIEGYFERAKRKTGMLFSLCTKGACIISGDKNLRAAEDYAMNIGIAFQIFDDLLLFKENYDEKTISADFENSITTLPVIFAAQNGVNIEAYTDFEAFKKDVLKTDAIDKSYKLALEYTNKAIENLENFKDNQYKKSLGDLTKFIVQREF